LRRKNQTPFFAEWGDDRSRYADAGSCQALAGTAPVPFESGNYAKAHKRFACCKPLRNHLHQFAWQSTRQEAWALDYYRRKRAEGKTHSMAVRALANISLFMEWRRLLLTVKKGDFDVYLIEHPHFALSCLALRRPPGARAAGSPLTGPHTRQVCLDSSNRPLPSWSSCH
jgi:hypothetical protein